MVDVTAQIKSQSYLLQTGRRALWWCVQAGWASTNQERAVYRAASHRGYIRDSTCRLLLCTCIEESKYFSHKINNCKLKHIIQIYKMYLITVVDSVFRVNEYPTRRWQLMPTGEKREEFPVLGTTESPRTQSDWGRLLHRRISEQATAPDRSRRPSRSSYHREERWMAAKGRFQMC